MRDLLKTDNAIGANVDWAKIDASAEKLTTKGAGEAVSAENFIAQKGPIPADKTPDSAQRIFNATASFEEQLKNAIYNNQDVFIDFLKANAQKLLGDLADEAGSLEEASKAFREFSEYEEN